MSVFRGTPGPWATGGHEWQKDRRYIYGTTQDGVNNPRIAIVEFGIDLGNDIQAETEANAKAISAVPQLIEAASDALAGWRYIRAQHGDLYGVGWDRVEDGLREALKAAGVEL